MMPMPPTGVSLLRMNNDESTLQLRAYARDEFRSDPYWIHAILRSRAVPLRVRFRRWLRGRGAKPAKVPAAPTPEPFPSAVPGRIEMPEDCPHPMMEDLGLDGSTKFLRCAACGVVFVVRGGDRWQIGPADDIVTSSAGDFPREDGVLVGPNTH